MIRQYTADQKPCFYLGNDSLSLIIRIRFSQAELLHFGAPLLPEDAEALSCKAGTGWGCSVLYDDADPLSSLDTLPLAWSGSGIGDYRESPIELSLDGVPIVPDFVYRSARITDNSEVAFNIGKVNIYYYTIINISYILLRLILVMFASLIFSVTTKPTEITSGLEFIFAPLKIIKVPVSKFAMSLSLALRFVPTLFETSNRIIKAQASRGVDYNHGKLREKIRAITTLIIPLFIICFLTSSSLADALEARGYNPSKKRSKYKYRYWSVNDTIFSIIIGLFLSIIIVESILKFDIFYLLNVELPILR